MLKSLLVIVLVCFGNFTAAVAGDGQILTNGSEYKIYKEPPPFTKTPYTIQEGLQLSSEQINNLIVNKKKNIPFPGSGMIIHSVFSKWYTHEIIAREYQGYGFKDNRIVVKSIQKEVEVFNPVLYFVILGLLFLVISTEFKSKYLRLADDDIQASFSKNEFVTDRKEAAHFHNASTLLACLVTIVAIMSNGFAMQAPFFSASLTAGVIVYLIFCTVLKESLIPNFVGITTLAMVSIAILF